MIKIILMAIFKLILSLVNLLLTPINSIISNFLPSLDNALTSIADFFDYIGGFIPWVISYTGLSSLTLTIIVDIIIFIFTVPLMVSTIKLALAWYNKLKI